jgi:NADH:ubiquinone oxidoreductase subunit C
LKRRLDDRLGRVLLAPTGQRNDTTEVRIRPGDVTDVMRTLHDEPEFRFELLSDLCGVDTGVTMQVVYHLWSPLSPDWLRVIADGLSRDDPRVPSVTFLWPGAEWAEREAYDMFGIIFEGNRDLRRIYLQPDFQAFPLRKDYLLPDDAARSAGMGVRPMEQLFQPAESRRMPILRQSAGTGALIGPDGQFLTLASGPGTGTPEPTADRGGGAETGRIGP